MSTKLILTHPKLTYQDKMPFGKYKGWTFEETPANYLIWLYDQDWCKTSWLAIRDFIHRNYEEIEEEALLQDAFEDNWSGERDPHWEKD